MLDYISGKILELILYELQLHQADIEALILDQVRELARVVTKYLEDNKLELEHDKADDESS